MKRLTLFITLLIISYNLFELSAQTNVIDSLENLLLQHKKKDTIRVNLLNETANKLYKVDLDKTLKYAEEARKLADKINFAKGKAESLRVIGGYYSYKSNYPKTLEYYLKSLAIYEELKDKKGIANCLNYIGYIYRKQNNYSQAFENFQKSLKINEELENIKGITYSLHNMGIIHIDQGNYPRALENFQKTLKINEKLRNKKGISYSLNSIGETYSAQGNYLQAITCFQKSLKIREEIGDKYLICISYKNFGSVYLKTNNYTKALDYTLKSLKIAIEIELLEGQKDIRKQLSEIYVGTKNYKKAYENYVLYKELNDSIFNEENIKKITRLEYQYEYEKEKQTTEFEQQKKDAVIIEEAKRQKTVRNAFIVGFILMTIFVLLVLRSFLQKRKANRILAVQKKEIELKNQELELQKDEIQTFVKELEKVNNTKDKFLSIIAHDLKSPFNTMLGFSNLLVNKFEKYSVQEQKKFLGILRHDIQNTYKLLENLLLWSATQRGTISFIPENENLYLSSDEIVKLLKQTAVEKSITIKNEIPGNIIVNADKDMFTTIMRNLISNAIKFTPKEGEITIKAHLITNENKQNYVQISVKDSGIGISKEKLSRLFILSEDVSTKGTEGEAGTGLGLTLCKEFVEKHGGKIWVESEERQGSTFSFSLPVKY